VKDKQQKSLLILGYDGSGTSMTSGLFRKSWFQGENLIPPTQRNPQGLYEDLDFVTLNGALLGGHKDVAWRSQMVKGFTPIEKISKSHTQEMEKWCHPPFAYKDPRSSATHRAWDQVFQSKGVKVGFVVVFRYPPEAITNTVKWAAGPSRQQLERFWNELYAFLLVEADEEPERYCFVEYKELLSRSSQLDHLQEFAGAELDRDFINPRWYRTRNRMAKTATFELYHKLQERANGQ